MHRVENQRTLPTYQQITVGNLIREIFQHLFSDAHFGYFLWVLISDEISMEYPWIGFRAREQVSLEHRMEEFCRQRGITTNSNSTNAAILFGRDHEDLIEIGPCRAISGEMTNLR